MSERPPTIPASSDPARRESPPRESPPRDEATALRALLPDPVSEFGPTSDPLPRSATDPAAAIADQPDVGSPLIDPAWKWHDEANVLLRAAIESANDAIIITEALIDLPGPRIEYVNPAFTAMTGYGRDEILGKTPRILQGPRTDRTLIQQLRSDLANDRVFHGEGINYRKDGSEYHVEWRITPLRDVDGTVLKWVAIQRDVTDRTHAEARRNELLATERAARADAERVSRLKDEFLSTLSHELRTPLNAILGWAQLLNSGRLSAEDARRAAETVERNARAQSQLIDDLLDMSRILNGGVRLDMVPLQLAGVVEAAVQTVRPTADAKSVRLDLLPSTAVHLVVGDATRLQQVIWNLLTNAVKFTPAGGTVTVALEPLAASPCGPELAIRVTDSGSGIDPAFLPYVFERFRQADASTTRQHGGLGLGLSIVKQLVELHGGRVEVESPGPNRGSTFTVRLPVSQHVAGVAPPTDPPPLAEPLPDEADADAAGMTICDLQGVTVMVVDDERDARSYLRNLLEQVGANVVECDGAADALASIGPRRPDVLVSDIGMPGTDGYELIRQVRTRRSDRERNTPAIALTAFARSEDRRRALLAGYQSHLAKPVDAVDLIVEIASLCGRARVGD